MRVALLVLLLALSGCSSDRRMIELMRRSYRLGCIEAGAAPERCEAKSLEFAQKMADE